MPRQKSAKASTNDGGNKKRKAATETADKKAKAASPANGANGSAQHETESGLGLLQALRDQLRSHMSAFQNFRPDAESVGRLRKIFVDWSKYAVLADEIVLPAFEEAGVEEDRVNEIRAEHDLISMLMSDLRDESPDGKFFPSKLKLLLRQITLLIDADENKATSLFAKAKATELDLEELGHELQATMSQSWFKAEEMMSDFAPRHLRGAGNRNAKKEHMSMRGQDRDRDEYGRFMPEDDRGGSHRGSRGMRGGSPDDDRRHSRSRDDDERGYRSQSSGGSGRHREDFDSDRGYRSHSSSQGGSSRSEGSSSGRSGNRSGGWFGDSEGHSEAARRGWDNPDHGESGWFGDSEGHSDASRRGWRNPDHGDSGWFGDREGHSQAARRGWDNPDHGRSGWFGDSEGHSEASRRGWEHRDDDDRRASGGRSSGSGRGASSRGGSGGRNNGGRGRYDD